MLILNPPLIAAPRVGKGPLVNSLRFLIYQLAKSLHSRDEEKDPLYPALLFAFLLSILPLLLIDYY